MGQLILTRMVSPIKITLANEGTISSEMMGRLLSSIKVKSVFRLNEVSYDKANLERFGIRHYDYCYADGSIPDEVFTY